MFKFVCRFVLICAVLGLAEKPTLRAQELTEQEALRRFEAESPQIQALTAQVNALKAEARGRSLFPNPSLSYTREDAGGTKDDFLVVQQPLPVTGRLGLLRRAGESAVKASQAETAYRIVQLRSKLRSAFYDLLLAQRLEVVLSRGVEELEEIVRILRAREQEGEGSMFDRLRAERELADTKIRLSDAEILRARAQSRVASFFAPGTDTGTLIARAGMNDANTVPPVEQLVERALEVRGDYQAGEWRKESLTFERKAARRQRIPEPVLSAGLKTVREFGFTDRGYVVSVTIPIPLFNRGQTEAARARAEQERTQAKQASLQQRIATEVKAAHAVAAIRRRIAEGYARELGDKGSELAQIARLAYREGEQGILELLDAHRVALDSQLRLLELLASAKQAEIELDRAVGEEVLP